MLKLSQKKRKALLALAVAAAVLGANNAFAASVHDKAITESTQYGSAARTYWKEAGVYNSKTRTYTFDEDVTLKPKASEQEFNNWTPMFGGIYIAGNKPITIDMQGHRLDIAMNVDQPNGVANVYNVNPNAIHVSSADLVINNVKGMELSAAGSFLSGGKLRGIYVAGTNQEGSYGDGKGLASLTINNADGWENAVKFHSSQPQIENAIEVWKNTGSADLKISGMVDLYVGNDSDVITVRGGNSNYNIDKAPTAYIGGGAIKAAMGRAAVVSGGELSINSKLQDGAIVAAEGSRDVQVEGNILVKDQQKDQGILTLGMNTDKSYFKGTIFNDNGAGEAYMLLANGAQWTNESKGDYGYHGSSLNQLVGGEADAKAGNIFQKDSGSLTISNYSGNTNIFYAHTGNGEAAENYAAGDTVIKSAAAGSVVSMITDNTGVAMDNKDSVANVLNALAGKLTYSNYVNGESNLTGYVKIADGLTASSAALKTGDISFNKEDGKGSYNASAVKPEVPTVKEYTDTLTGMDFADEAYADVIKDGVYKFTQDTKITNQYAIDLGEDVTIDATGKTLTLVVKDVEEIGSGVKVNIENDSVIKADTLKMELTGTDIVTGSGLKGINVTNKNAKLTIDSKLDITANGDADTIGIYNRGNVVVNGDVKLDIEGNDGGNAYYGASGLYATSSMGNSKGGTITVNGNVDFQGNANGLFANAGGSKIFVKGGNIVVKEGQTVGYSAIRAENGVVNMNVIEDENGNVTGADKNDVTIKGNIGVTTGAVNVSDIHGTKSEINLGLTTDKSSLTGVVQNSFGDGVAQGNATFTGAANLWLQNGATWNNVVVDTLVKNPANGEKWSGSHVAKLVGGESEAKAGNIFQKDSNNLTIDNYSGNTNIFYAHTGNGENASNYAAGDTIIKGAAAGSAVSLITDNTGISMNNDASVANVLNALAGKLTYSNFVNGENNLNGSVKIADGLTSSSQTLKVDTIKFNKDTGKGYTKEETVNPGGGEKTTFTDAITGEKQGVFSAVQQEDLSYVFAEDASININQMTHKEKDPDWEGSFIISGAAVQNAAGVENLVINAADKTLKLNVALDSKTVPPDKNAGILNNRIPLRGVDNSIAGSTTSITAGTLDINIDNTYSRKTSTGNPLIGEGSAIGIYAKSAGEKAVVEVTGNTAIKAHGYNNVYGVNANGNAEVKLHGDLTMAKDGEDWALDNVIKGQNTTTLGESSWRNIAGINANGAGASVTVDGKTTIAAHGSGVVAADGATVNLGAADIEVKNNSDEAGYGFHALGAALGTVNVGGEGKTVTVKGNAGLFGKQGQKFAGDSKESVINLKLTTEDSAWTGVAYKHFDAEKDAGLSGSMNLTLTNGASWTNEKYGYTYGDSEWEKYKFTGSEIADFVGGASEAKAGNIFQKDANSLTIDNYSGNTNIFYAHTGNGEAAENYAAGDTVIKHAAEGSVVSMITDNSGIAMDNQASVNNVLNTLAGKLTYSNFVSGEKNLTGFVKIADGLTASSAALKTGDITFNEADGKGGFVSGPVIPDHQVTTSFTTTLTGDKEQDEEYLMGGVIAEDGTYKFTETSDITAVSAINTAKDLKIDATGKTLTVNTAGTDSAAIKVLNDGGSKVDIKADKLVIKSSSEYAGKNSGIYAGDWNTTRKNVNITADVDITATNTVGNNNYVYGVLASKADITVNGSLKANIDGGKGGYDHTSVSALIAQGSSYRKYASTITVNGDVDITANGNGLHANNNGAVVTVNGGGAITVNDSSAKGGYAALRAGNGTVNMNVALENGKATGGLGHDAVIKGNLAAVKAGDQTASVINLALDTAKSSLEGVSYMTEGNGQINLWLQNGASWTNEVHGSAEKDWKGNSLFNGSHVTNFAGGASDAKAGNIFQKDSNALTIDSYSGNTNIFYAHTGNGEAASDYAAGDTIIKSAAEGSVVSMITDNTGVAMDNEYSVANVLNALAGKLTYSNFVNGEKNLTGYVKIADGLTASSKAMQTGNISFSTETGKGSLESGSMTPGITYPETQKPGSNKLNQGITGNAKDDYQLKMDGILKADGSYVFTQDPTVIEVKEGAAVNASASDIVIDTTKAKLELKGADAGINADGANVNIKGNTNISGTTGINAANGNVTLNGSTVINGTDAAINAGADANVVVNGNNSALTVNGSINADGGNITVDSGKATGTITGDINAANGGSVVINLTEKNSEMTGGYNVDGDSSIALGLANGATWHLTDGEEAAGMSLLRMAKGAADAGLTINGGKTEAEKGFLDMTERTKTLDIAHYSGWETVIYDHEGKGDKVEDYKSGDTVIAKADKGSGVILSTDGSGITMTDKNAVEATLKALAQKVTYKDHAANGENLSGKVQIAEGLTSSSVSKNLGTIHWDENGKGQYDLDSVNWNQIIEGDYETFVMKGVRSAVTTSLHTWRDNMQDTYTGADLADEDGMFAKALGGKTSSDVKGLKDSNTYYGVQIGYDKAAANGWHTGVAFDYRNGDSNYLLGGKGDNQMYSLGVYGVKNFDNDAFFRVAAKVGRVENEYDVYNEIRSLKLNGDYKANAYGLTMEYGKTFGDEEAYFTPKAQLTWSQVGSKDYTAHTDNATMQISQDSYSSFVGRLGFEAGVKSEKGRVYAGLFAAHEFNGDISASYFANDGDRKHTSFDGEETWMEMKLGGTYDFSNNAHLYADIAKDFNGNFERKWKMNVGLRFEF